MSFSNISKFFAIGFVLSSFGLFNAYAQEIENVKVEETATSENDATKNDDKNVEGNTLKEGSKNLGSVSVKSSEFSSESSYVIEQDADGIIRIYDSNKQPKDSSSDSVSKTQVYSRTMVKSYNVIYTPDEGLVCKEVESKTSESIPEENKVDISSNEEVKLATPAGQNSKVEENVDAAPSAEDVSA